MAAGLTDHVWTLKEVLRYRVPRGLKLSWGKGWARMVIVRSGKASVLAIRSTGLQEVQQADSRAQDPLMHTLQRARETSILFIRKAEAHDPSLPASF